MPTPYEKPVASYPTPNIEDALYAELVDIGKGAYRPFNPGEPYPDQAQLPGYKFLMQEPVNTGDGNDKIVRQVWCKDRFGQETYNAIQKDVQAGAGYPVFVRTFIVPRFGPDGTPYQSPNPELTPLGALIGITINSGGSGYEAVDGLQVALTFTGGAGSGATGYGIISPTSGEITNCYITNGGSGYTSAPAVTAAGGNNNFSGTGVLQPQGAVLVEEESRPAEGQLGALYLSVTRVYHTLPGPTLRQWIWDAELRMYVKVTKTIVSVGSVPSGSAPSPSTGVIEEYQPLDANRYVKIESSIVYASGGAPPASFTYPTVVQHYPLPNEILTDPEPPYLYYAWAFNSNQNFALDVGLFYNMREGYSGPFKGRITEYYTFDPTSIVLPSLTIFNPQAHSFGIAWWYASDSQASAQVINMGIPQSLHPEITLGSDGDSGSADINTITIPATTPTAVPQETWITINFTEPRPYKFGLYIYRKLEIYIPALTP